MKMRQLEQFITICETGSISKASVQLHIAQPALGLQMRQLEKTFGSQLLLRHPRGVQPTPAGEIVLAWAKDMLEQSVGVKRRVRAVQASRPVTLTLGMSPSTSSLLAVRLLGRVQEVVPALKLRVVEELSHILAEWIQEERLDLALLFDCEAQLPSAVALACENLYFVTSLANAARLVGDGTSIRLRDALAWPLVMPSEIGPVRKTVEAAARQLGLVADVAFEVHSMDVVRDLLRCGQASGIIPYSLVERDIAGRHVTARLVVEPTLSRTLRLVRSPACAAHPQTDALERLIQAELQAACGNEPDRGYRPLIQHQMS